VNREWKSTKVPRRPLLADCNAPQMGQTPPAYWGATTTILICANGKYRIGCRNARNTLTQPLRERTIRALGNRILPLFYTASRSPFLEPVATFLGGEAMRSVRFVCLFVILGNAMLAAQSNTSPTYQSARHETVCPKPEP
jgi:hypothetical protein